MTKETPAMTTPSASTKQPTVLIPIGDDGEFYIIRGWGHRQETLLEAVREYDTDAVSVAAEEVWGRWRPALPHEKEWDWYWTREAARDAPHKRGAGRWTVVEPEA